MADFNRYPGASGGFPGTGNIDVYKYQNDFDYSRWGPTTRYRVVDVPWVGDYRDVVAFESAEARDEYLDGLEGEWLDQTMVHVKPDVSVKLPLPVTVMNHFNYLIVDLPMPTSEGQPIRYADEFPRIGRFLYFIENARQASPSTTVCDIQLDYWQTYIYTMHIDYVMLDRGHAPMAAIGADEYLKNPRANCGYLITPDVGTGREPSIVASGSTVVLNDGDVLAAFCTYADLAGGWGSISATTATVPAASYTQVQGAPAPSAYAVPVADLASFLADVDAQCPQFKGTVAGVFLVQSSVVEQGATVQFCGHAMRALTASQQVRPLVSLDRQAFGYPAPYSDIAKLYTYPYAYIRISDHEGRTNIVRVEDTNGNIDVRACASLVFPYIAIDSHLLGIGGADATLTFRTAEGRSYTYGGAFAATMRRWGVPVYQVSQRAYTAAEWQHLYDRAQAQLAASNANASTLASNATAKVNADNSAANITANNAVGVACNNTLTANANEAASDGVDGSNSLAYAATVWDNDSCSAAYEAQQDALAVAATNNNLQAASGAASTVIGAMSELLSGDIGGAIGTALSGGVNTATAWTCANNSNTVSQSNSTTIYNQTISSNNGKTNNSISYATASTNIQNNQRSADNSAQNSASTSIAANNAGLVSQNAANVKNTGDANAARTLQTATSAIQNGWNQQGLAAPALFGSTSAGDYAVTRPMGYFAQIVTQPAGAIRQAGDAFLRFGYKLDQAWSITKWQVMRYFTFWQCSEVWCYGPGDAIDGAQQQVKAILAAGVTVWSDPAKIGRVSVYDNI